MTLSKAAQAVREETRLRDDELVAEMTEAAEAGRMGWNLRCNRCGQFGATWIPGQRPGWGSLALCSPHEAELNQEIRRHDQAMAALRKVEFEQPYNVEKLAERVMRRKRGGSR